MRGRWLKPKSGFTLIELTLAMTLTVMIVTLLYAAFFVGYRAMEKASSRSEPAADRPSFFLESKIVLPSSPPSPSEWAAKGCLGLASPGVMKKEGY